MNHEQLSRKMHSFTYFVLKFNFRGTDDGTLESRPLSQRSSDTMLYTEYHKSFCCWWKARESFYIIFIRGSTSYVCTCDMPCLMRAGTCYDLISFDVTRSVCLPPKWVEKFQLQLQVM